MGGAAVRGCCLCARRRGGCAPGRANYADDVGGAAVRGCSLCVRRRGGCAPGRANYADGGGGAAVRGCSLCVRRQAGRVPVRADYAEGVRGCDVRRLRLFLCWVLRMHQGGGCACCWVGCEVCSWGSLWQERGEIRVELVEDREGSGGGRLVLMWGKWWCGVVF